MLGYLGPTSGIHSLQPGVLILTVSQANQRARHSKPRRNWIHSMLLLLLLASGRGQGVTARARTNTETHTHTQGGLSSSAGQRQREREKERARDWLGQAMEGKLAKATTQAPTPLNPKITVVVWSAVGHNACHAGQKWAQPHMAKKTKNNILVERPLQRVVFAKAGHWSSSTCGLSDLVA
ncbi:hypothetical protein PoB_001510800 [Plakobranchus ocellatus]|uniref:Uncharacterized protein n=1 Tax=Plakobranchus ocellatus TaxID=259542 RepID=A0AAV3Z1X1_9GAST|nr:hypothetical protein PoB_001510800 [Plakobranchus ocellatus]